MAFHIMAFQSRIGTDTSRGSMVTPARSEKALFSHKGSLVTGVTTAGFEIVGTRGIRRVAKICSSAQWRLVPIFPPQRRNIPAPHFNASKSSPRSTRRLRFRETLACSSTYTIGWSAGFGRGFGNGNSVCSHFIHHILLYAR